MPYSKSLSILSLFLVLGASACTAGDQLREGLPMQNQETETLLNAGVREATADVLPEAVAPLIFYIENNSDEDIKVLSWNTPLEKTLSANVFSVIYENEEVSYFGRKVKRGTPVEKDFLLIEAHGRIETALDMTMYYDMQAPGRYSVSLSSALVERVALLNEMMPLSLQESSVVFDIEPRSDATADEP